MASRIFFEVYIDIMAPLSAPFRCLIFLPAMIAIAGFSPQTAY